MQKIKDMKFENDSFLKHIFTDFIECIEITEPTEYS